MFNFLASLLITGFLASFGIFPIQPVLSSQEITGPIKINPASLGIEITAKSAIIIDVNSGAVLFSKNANAERPIASITKLMTTLVFLDNNPGWNEVIVIEESDRREGNIVRLWPGDKVKILDLFNLTLVSSTNEATSALVRSTGLSEEDFVRLMNDKARDLGLKNTKFFEPTGLDPKNISSAYDLSLLAREVFVKEEVKEATKRSVYWFTVLNTGRQRAGYATNELLWSFLNNEKLGYRLIGAKTGYLDEAFYCLAAQISKEDNNIVTVVLGSETANDRWQEVKGLADWAYENFYWQ